MTFQATPGLGLSGTNVDDPSTVKPHMQYRPPVPIGGTAMKTGRISAMVDHPRRILAMVLLTGTFAAGLATGQGLQTVAASGPDVRGELLQGAAGTGTTGNPAGQAPLACFASPVLDTSKPYLTIQHGVIVPGR